MTLKASSNAIRKADQAAYIRRVMWSSLDERIKEVFDKHATASSEINILGNIYLSKSGDDLKHSNKHELLSFQRVNSTHIHTGNRFLGVHVINYDENKYELATERNCQLWFSQSPSGEVLAMIAPYQSNAGRIDEKEIIIGKYKEPSSLTYKNIEKHFNTFFKYCSCTSQNNASNWLSYAYRQLLIYRDFRYKSKFNAKAMRMLERILIFSFGVVSAWAALQAIGKT